MATKKQPKLETASAGMLAALKFVNIAQRTIGPPHTRHCVLFDDMVYASDGILTAGHKIEEHLQAAPHTLRLIAALERCKEHMSIAVLASGLSVRSDRFRATVPCMELNVMPKLWPDPPVAPLDDAALRAAFDAVGPLATEGAPKVIQACVRLSAGSACATNGFMLIEYWHGINLPTILVPKASVKALESVKKKFTQFGCSDNSATFYYEDGSWIKTQLYVDVYPNIDKVMDKPSDQWPITPGFFDALRTVLPFVDDERGVLFSKNLIHTEFDKEAGASYELGGIPEGHCFNIDMLMLIEPLANTIDFGKDTKRDELRFFGNKVRGALARKMIHQGRPIEEARRAAAVIQPKTAKFDDMGDDIPF